MDYAQSPQDVDIQKLDSHRAVRVRFMRQFRSRRRARL